MFGKLTIGTTNFSVFTTRPGRFLQPNALKSVLKMQQNMFLRALFSKNFRGGMPPDPPSNSRLPRSISPPTPKFVPPGLVIVPYIMHESSKSVRCKLFRRSVCVLNLLQILDVLTMSC